ncbi:hypothetical protein BASA81_006668 [Batrachochytrium salamandrivorans]|nr:hypothetical protein BASA81_006668 [Batrachochytrium salamandrivorans]
MAGLLGRTRERALDLVVPEVSPPALQVALGLLNCCVFGLGVLLAGLVNRDWADVLIGLLQLLVPVLGWIWAVLWGVLMVLKVIV